MPVIVQTPFFASMEIEVQAGSVELKQRVTGPGKRCYGVAGVPHLSSLVTVMYSFVLWSEFIVNFRVTSISSNARGDHPLCFSALQFVEGGIY